MISTLRSHIQKMVRRMTRDDDVTAWREVKSALIVRSHQGALLRVSFYALGIHNAYRVKLKGLRCKVGYVSYAYDM